LAGIVGQFISMYAVFGDTVRQSTRFVCMTAFYANNCRLLNSKGSIISTMTVNTVFDRVFFCDETTYVMSAYHHYRCEFEPRSAEVYSIQHYVIKLVCDFR
jgi:hypothetical protein